MIKCFRGGFIMTKTNALRILDKQKIKYTVYEYENDGHIDGMSVANKLSINPDEMFKTLVTIGADKNYYVFVIPINHELDLKLAAKAVSVKSIAMIHVADINKVTGYIRGGCSPVGMKKAFKTAIDERINLIDTIYVSAGKIGIQMNLDPKDLIRCTNAQVCSVCVE